MEMAKESMEMSKESIEMTKESTETSREPMEMSKESIEKHVALLKTCINWINEQTVLKFDENVVLEHDERLRKMGRILTRTLHELKSFEEVFMMMSDTKARQFKNINVSIRSM